MKAKTSQVAVSDRMFTGKQAMLFVGLAVLVTALGTAWWVNQYVFASMFEPTRLSVAEQQILDARYVHQGGAGQNQHDDGN